MHPLATRATRIDQLRPMARHGSLAHRSLARRLACALLAHAVDAASARQNLTGLTARQCFPGPSIRCSQSPSRHVVAAAPRLTIADAKSRLQLGTLADMSRAPLRDHWADRHATHTCSAPTRNQALRNGTRRPTRKPDLYEYSESSLFMGGAAVPCISKRQRAAAPRTLK